MAEALTNGVSGGGEGRKKGEEKKRQVQAKEERQVQGCR